MARHHIKGVNVLSSKELRALIMVKMKRRKRSWMTSLVLAEASSRRPYLFANLISEQDRVALRCEKENKSQGGRHPRPAPAARTSPEYSDQNEDTMGGGGGERI